MMDANPTFFRLESSYLSLSLAFSHLKKPKKEINITIYSSKENILSIGKYSLDINRIYLIILRTSSCQYSPMMLKPGLILSRLFCTHGCSKISMLKRQWIKYNSPCKIMFMRRLLLILKIILYDKFILTRFNKFHFCQNRTRGNIIVDL